MCAVRSRRRRGVRCRRGVRVVGVFSSRGAGVCPGCSAPRGFPPYGLEGVSIVAKKYNPIKEIRQSSKSNGGRQVIVRQDGSVERK